MSFHIAKKSDPTLQYPLGFGNKGIPPNAKCTTYLGLQTNEDLVEGSACLTQQPQSVQIDQRRELNADVLQGIGS